MGIPSYFSYIIKNHGNIIKKHNDIEKIYNFYLDSNSIIYDAIKEIEYNKNNKDYENKIYIFVINKIDALIKIVKPCNQTIIAFDGVAPMAKLQQQKTRRYKSKLNEKLLTLFGKEVKEVWDRAAITPGSSFMSILGNRLLKYYSKNKNISISTSSIPGEGEHKIFEYIRKNPKKHLDKPTYIYGLDADLIMLCLNCLEICNKIYVFRETPEFIKSLDSSLEPETLYCMDISDLAIYISEEVTKKKHIDNTIISDYILLCFFLGNDFMPHFPSLNIRTNGIYILLSAYHNSVYSRGERLISNERIDWRNLRYLTEYLANIEESNIIEENKIRERWGKRNYCTTTLKDIETKITNIPTKLREDEEFINPQYKNWESRYYIKLFETEPNNVFLKEVSINYMEGLEWVYKYYKEGCVDWNWRYNYHYPPLFKDLLEFMPYWDTTMIEPNNNIPLPEIVQLSYVLPRESLKLLPNKIRNMLLDKYGEFYPEDANIKWAYCKYLWESHVDFADICLDDFKKDILKIL